jgi:hypothetical protein
VAAALVLGCLIGGGLATVGFALSHVVGGHSRDFNDRGYGPMQRDGRFPERGGPGTGPGNGFPPGGRGPRGPVPAPTSTPAAPAPTPTPTS